MIRGPGTPLDSLTAAVADQNFFHRTLIGDALRGMGLECRISAKDGEGLLRDFQECKPDVVIMASRLPKISGLEMTRLIRTGATPLPRETAIIATSTDPTETFLDAAERSGVDELLAIPFQPLALRRRLEAVVGKRRAFVDTPAYVGPCRRRRQDETYGGPLRRITDVIAPAAAETPADRSMLRSRIALLSDLAPQGVVENDRGLMRVYDATREVAGAAQALGEEAVAQAADLLARYLAAMGAADLLEARVVNTHVRALQTLCALPSLGAEERRLILTGLHSAVERRIQRLQRVSL